MKNKTLAAIILACLTSTVWAWGSEGQRLVAHIAETQLTAKASQGVNALLAQEPGATLESISTWADEHKSRATSKWHYVNFPQGTCHYEPERDCPDGNCVVAALDKQINKLKTEGSAEERLKALKYVVHLMGDVHQPLHAGWEFDKGGNKFQIQAFGRGSNLHALWDSGLINHYEETKPGWEQRLVQQAKRQTDLTWSVANVAQESCEAASSAGFYPTRFVGAEYA